MKFAKHTLLAAMGAVAVAAAGPALARNMDLVGAGPSGDDLNINMKMSASETGAYKQAPGQFRAENLVGRSLTNAQGKSIGDTKSVLIDQDGKVAALVVGIGGYLGIDQHRVAIAWKDIQVLDGGKTLKTNLTREQLQGLPEFHYKQTAKNGAMSIKQKYPKNTNEPGFKPAGQSR